MPRVQRMDRSAGDTRCPPPSYLCESTQVHDKRSCGDAPVNWPFPTWKGVDLPRSAKVTRKQRLKQLEDATW